MDSPTQLTPCFDALIPGEIKNDALAQTLTQLAAQADISSILEVGSASGAGSTAALVEGVKQRSKRAELYCVDISAARIAKLRETYGALDFVHAYGVSSVALHEFPTWETVEAFYDAVDCTLRIYPKPVVFGWFQAEHEYLKALAPGVNGIAQIKAERGLPVFDLVLLDGSEFAGEADLRSVYGSKYIVLDDIKAAKNWNNYFQLQADPGYELMREERSVRNGFCVFKRVDAEPRLPVHFFTIVLNGMPFLRYHIEMLRALPFEWHWHVVEGVADLKHDTAWSVGNGGAVTEELHFLGRSRDGTTEYLDQLRAQYPDKVTIYRKPPGVHWDGKLEMVGAPLANIRSECLLWEIDADELWTAAKIIAARKLFIQDPALMSAYYWCHFFVGPELAVSTRNCYSQNPGMEWLRTWRYYPHCRWVAHEPPRLAGILPSGGWVDQGAVKPLLHAQSEAAGLVFHHYAYATPAQLRFKEIYYGYRNAVTGWRALQAQHNFPCPLSDYFPWVRDHTQVDRAERLGIAPIAGTGWLFEPAAPTPAADIVVDAVFFQYYNTGIARVWRSLLGEWAQSDFGRRLVILDRAGKAPRIAGLRYLEFPAHNYADLAHERRMVQRACDYTKAQLFISSYYTGPETTASVMLVHDMIPELLDADLNHPMWVEKTHAIKTAAAFVCVSENTASDLRKFHPQIEPARITVCHNGVAFRQSSPEQINDFKSRHGIQKPYFMISGGRSSYKNTILFFNAFAQLGEQRANYALLCTGPRESLQPEFAALAGNASLHVLDLTDQDLECAYAGAVALVYPSLYEGFGMPIIEAMACGCPVITCPNGPLPEVAGDAALYVPAQDPAVMLLALNLVQQPEQRNSLIAKGLERAKLFSWKKMAEQMAAVLSAQLHAKP